jgi:hypothetical protein
MRSGRGKNDPQRARGREGGREGGGKEYETNVTEVLHTVIPTFFELVER